MKSLEIDSNGILRRSQFRKGTKMMVMAGVSLLWVTLALGQTTNQVPNPELRGDQGASFGNVAGTVPTLWRAFTVGPGGPGGGGNMTIDVVPLAADALFAGSPPTNAIRITALAFGNPDTDDMAFDHSPLLFSLVQGGTYSASVYLRSDNGDGSDQSVDLGVPIFDETDTFTGAAPGSFTATATPSWTRAEGPQFSAFAVRSAHLAFRMVNDGGDNSLLLALPRVNGQSLENRVPNPEFSGTSGVVTGSVTGPVPDMWRGFAIDNGDVALAKVAVAADELYPGSPATTAMQVTVNSFSDGVGFDHEGVPFSLAPGRKMWGEVYMRSANADQSSQFVTISIPVFDQAGFTGRFPGQFQAIVGTQWGYYAGPSFAEQPDTTANLQFRLADDDGDNSLLIAMPQVNGLADRVFASGFEGQAAARR